MRIIYLFTFLLIFTDLLAQENWDLEKCINYAIEHSLDVQRANLDINDANNNNIIQEKQRLPSLSGTVGAQTSFGRSIDATTNEFTTKNTINNSFGLNGGITLFNGGRLKNNIRQSELDKQAFMADKNSMIANVTLSVVAAYFEALFAKDNYANVEIQLKTINDQIDQMTKLVEAGSRAQFEIYDLEAQQASSEQDLTIAQNRIDLAMLSLKGVLNLDPNVEMELSTPPTDQTIYTDLDNVQFEDFYNKSAGERPEILALDLRIQSSQVGVELANGLFHPTVTAGWSIGSNYSNRFVRPTGFREVISEQSVFIDGNPAILGINDFELAGEETTPYFSQLDQLLSYGAGVQVNIPIFNNYFAKGEKERARINLDRSQIDKDQYVIDLRNLLGQYLTDAKAAKRTLEASNKVLAARQVAYENAERRFNLGAINSFDYISIQDQLNTARTDQIISKYDFMMKVKILDFYQGYPVTLK